MKKNVDIAYPSKEKRYNTVKIKLSIVSAVYSFFLLGVVAFSGVSYFLYDYIKSLAIPQNDYIVFLVFIVMIAVGFSLLTMPVDFYTGYVNEHRFALSTQSVFGWLWDYIKSAFLSAVIGLVVAFVFFFLLRFSVNYWWIYFGIFMFLITVVLAQITPLVILPLFYKFKSIDDEKISRKIIELLEKQHIKISGIYSFNISKETKKANAAFTGLGRSRRIILSDTLIYSFTADEIAVVFAHEMGHYKKKHIFKNLLLSTAIIFISSFGCNLLYQHTLTRFGFMSGYEIPAIPILLFYIAIASITLVPLANLISRTFEKNADMFSLALTSNKEAFISAMEKLAKINLADKTPHPLIEFLFYSHPSIGKRIDMAHNYFNKDITFSND